MEALLGWLKENGLKYVLSIMSHKNALLTVDKIEKYKQYKLMELELELGN